MRSASRGFRLLIAIGLATVGCASSQGSEEAPSRDGGLSNAEIEALFEARTRADRERYVQADVDFMTGMIHHHAQAIEIARMAPDRTADASIRTLAARIINAQRDEIVTMQRWLADREQPAPQVHVTDVGLPVVGHGHGHGASHEMMPGMLGQDQIQELEGTRGSDFDRLFLTLMIEHHLGAVHMVRELFATDGAAQDEEVFRFASDVQVDQATEVARMERMLRGMDGSHDPR